MQTFFDNINTKVVDDLKVSIKDGSFLSIASACFSIYAFEELKAQLKDIEELRFIFTAPSFVNDRETKQRREFYIPRLDRERTLYGSEFEVKLRNQMTQKAIYAKFELKLVQRDHFDEDISKMAIVNAISPTTIPALQKGTDVECNVADNFEQIFNAYSKDTIRRIL